MGPHGSVPDTVASTSNRVAVDRALGTRAWWTLARAKAAADGATRVKGDGGRVGIAV